jgi:predicted amidophosphoribosyltransferase
VGLRLEERHSNIAGAFGAIRPLRGRRVVIVDDVLTTGSTAAAVAAAALAAGASSVDIWCVARAAAPEQVDWRLQREESGA